jgi:hypothetical protein
VRSPRSSCCSVVELRQYTTHPGRRDGLVELFDRELVEPQEAHGMHVVGQFRDLDRPDMFVWLRGFPDMETRGNALAGFYGGPVWKQHRDAANATMADSDNVLLLRPASPGAGLTHQGLDRTAPATDTPAESRVEVTVCPLEAPAGDDLLADLRLRALPALDGALGRTVACYVTEPAENNFPALPVRPDNVLVWISRPDNASGPRGTHAPDLTTEVLPTLEKYLDGPPQTMRLSPTPRSQLR